MRHSHQFLLPVAALLAGALACEAAEKTPDLQVEATNEKPRDPVAEGKRITFRPQEAKYQIETNFDDDGSVRNTETTLRLSVRVNWPNDINLVGVNDIRITEAVLDSGETVVPRSLNKERMNSHFSPNGSGENRYGYVQVPLAAPGGSFTAIKKVTGVIVMSIAGPAKEAELKPLSAFLGKSLALEGLNGEEITVERDKVRGITISMPSDLQKRLAKVSFTDGAGTSIETNGWGGSSNNDEYKQSYRVQVPDDGAMTISFYGDFSTLEAPLSLSDLPLAAKPASKEKTKVVLKTNTPSPEKPAEKLKVTPPKSAF